MATSGSFITDRVYAGGSINEGTEYERHLIFEWSLAEQDITSNTTKINWSVKGGGSGASGYLMCGPVEVRIPEATVEVLYSNSTRFGLRVGTEVASGTAIIAHDSTGEKSFSASVEATIKNSSISSGSGTWELPSIARASVIHAANNTTLGSNCNVKWYPLHKDFSYRLKFSMGTWSNTVLVQPKTTALYIYTSMVIPLEAASQIPNSKTGTMKAELFTYSDSAGKNQVGETSSKTFTVTVPSSAGPKAVMNLSPESSLLSPFDTMYIQKKSKVTADFSQSTGQYGATIKSCTLSVRGNTDSISPYESDILGDAGSVEVRGTVTDSRGFTTEIVKTIMVLPYEPPKIIPYTGFGGITCSRCLEDGTIDPSGAYLRIRAGRKYSPIEPSTAQTNFCFFGYRYAASGSEMPANYTSLLVKNNTSTDMVDVTLNLSLDGEKSYIVELYVEDDLGQNSMLSFAILTEQVAFHLKEKGAAFGKYSEEEDTLDVAWDIRMRGRVRFGNGNDMLLDFVTERGKSVVGAATWHYRKWESGRIEMWCRQDIQSGVFNGENNLFYSNVISVPLPFNTDSEATSASVSVHSSGITWAATAGAWGNQVSFSVGRMYGGTDSLALTVQIYVSGLLAS